jgi:hypothetical protein
MLPRRSRVRPIGRRRILALHTKNSEYSGWGSSCAIMARPMAMMVATMPSMRSVLVLRRLEIAGGVLGHGDIGGHPAGRRRTARGRVKLLLCDHGERAMMPTIHWVDLGRSEPSRPRRSAGASPLSLERMAPIAA